MSTLHSPETVHAIAKAIEGPHREPPPGSPHSLDELRKIRWHMLSVGERGERIAQARAAINAIDKLSSATSTASEG